MLIPELPLDLGFVTLSPRAEDVAVREGLDDAIKMSVTSWISGPDDRGDVDSTVTVLDDSGCWRKEYELRAAS